MDNKTLLAVKYSMLLYSGGEHTYWLSLQEVDVVKHLPLFGPQIVQPVLNNTLTLLETIRIMERILELNLKNIALHGRRFIKCHLTGPPTCEVKKHSSLSMFS